MFRKMASGLVTAVAVAILVSGCIDSKTEIAVKKDGGGTIVQTSYLGAMAVMMMRQMEDQAEPSDTTEKKKDENPLLTEENLKAYKQKAPQMGEGVTFVSADGLKKEDGSPGVKVTYAFKDINQLKYSTMQDGGNGTEVKADGGQFITFNFKKANGGNKLTIILPIDKKSGDQPAISEKSPSPEEIAQAKMMFAGLRVALSVKVGGKITGTNASFKGNNHDVILFDLNMDEVMEDAGKFEEIIVYHAKGMALGVVPGVRRPPIAPCVPA